MVNNFLSFFFLFHNQVETLFVCLVVGFGAFSQVLLDFWIFFDLADELANTWGNFFHFAFICFFEFRSLAEHVENASNSQVNIAELKKSQK